jgi:hypothetical protein
MDQKVFLEYATALDTLFFQISALGQPMDRTIEMLLEQMMQAVDHDDEDHVGSTECRYITLLEIFIPSRIDGECQIGARPFGKHP